MKLPYKVKNVIYYGERGYYTPDRVNQMLLDGFQEKDGDILIPIGLSVRLIQDEFGDDDSQFEIGNNIYDLYIDEALKEEYLEPMF